VKGFRKHFVTGLVVLLPLLLTVFVLMFFIRWISGITRPFVFPLSVFLLGIENEGLISAISFCISLLSIYLIGLAANSIFGKQLIALMENSIERVPGVRDIYTSARKLINFFTEYQSYHGNQVVVVEYPRKGLYTFGIVTFESKDVGKLGVFMPSTPNPTTGYFLLVDKKEVIPTSLTFEDAVKIIVSGGVVNRAALEQYLKDL